MRNLFILIPFLFIACSAEEEKKEEGQEKSIANKTEEPVSDGHTSKTALDWQGTYTGVTPCADCEGIETIITLKDDGRYSRKMLYLGKSKTPLMSAGKFEWNEAGSVVTLLSPSGSDQMYKVGENQLIHLDQEGQRITGDLADQYVLKKNFMDPRVEEFKWALEELNGEKVTLKEGMKAPFIEFDAVEARIAGNGSCNRFFGEYALSKENGLEVGNRMGVTQMACPDMSLEQEFLKTLKTVDTYEVDDASLVFKSGGTVVARFSK